MQPKEELTLYQSLLFDAVTMAERWQHELEGGYGYALMYAYCNGSPETKARLKASNDERATRKRDLCLRSIERLTEDVQRLEAIVSRGGANA